MGDEYFAIIKKDSRGQVFSIATSQSGAWLDAGAWGLSGPLAAHCECIEIDKERFEAIKRGNPNAFTTRQFNALSAFQQTAILALAAHNGAPDGATFDEDLADISLGLFEPSDPGCVLPSCFMEAGEVDRNLAGKIQVMYRTAIALAGIPACEIVVQAEPDHDSRVAVLLADNPGRCILYETFTSIEYQFANLAALADEILDIVGALIKASAGMPGSTRRTTLRGILLVNGDFLGQIYGIGGGD